VNWAPSGTATATSEESGNPAGNAIDGDAGTDWCTSSYTGILTVDLGQVRALSDLGLTLDPASPSASATIELASTAGNWQQVRALKDIALDPDNPMYFPLPGGTQARYAELTVYSDTGADVCVGEFRACGPRRGRVRPGPRRGPVVHAAGTRRGRDVQLRRPGRRITGL
jgi:F5/8 type C domain